MPASLRRGPRRAVPGRDEDVARPRDVFFADGNVVEEDENGQCAWGDANEDEERRERLAAEQLRLAASRPLEE